MTIQELFIRSNLELQRRIEQISDAQWTLELPAGLTSRPATLEDAVRYHTYDDAWVPDVLAGKTKEDVGNAYEFILTIPPADILTTYVTYNQVAREAVQQYSDLDRTVHLSYGDFSARDYLQHIISFRAFRVYDIARFIGADTHMADDFVQALWDEFSPVVETYRQMGVFPAPLEVPENADLQTRLLALVGRAS
jgi:hypothetical protein